MRFERVTADCFGPFSDRSLQFAPGMNVFYGPNEAGKSSWHSALYAALCGIRRGAGLRKEDHEFATRHRPWHSNDWEVGATIALEDGRRVELRHDLAGRVACRAEDATLGRDYSSEIIREGSPDGSGWLGLNRRSFLAVACVRQADVLGVLKDPGLLQDHLQRAAATSGMASTAAAALERLERFHAEQVGLDRANSRRPLRRAIESLEAARRDVEHAHLAHTEYLELVAGARTVREEAINADEQLRLARARLAVLHADTWHHHLEMARSLAKRFRDGPPQTLTAGDELAGAVAAALRAWEQLPDIPVLFGPTSLQLRSEIDSLSQVPLPDARTDGGDVVSNRKNQRTGLFIAGAAGFIVGIAAWTLLGLAIPGLILSLIGSLAVIWGLRRRGDDEDHLRAQQKRHEGEKATMLRAQLDLRKGAERVAEAVTARRQQAEHDLRDVARQCGVSAASDELIAEALRGWQTERIQQLKEKDEASSTWVELQRLLGGRTLKELEAEVGRHRSLANRLAGEFDEYKLATVILEDDTDAQVHRLEEQARQAARESDQAHGQVGERARSLPSVPEAEERLNVAEAELGQQHGLEHVIKLTRQFLEQAQDRVHRDIAPVLAATVRNWLPAVTGDRYCDVRVDPRTLNVQVLDQASHWRDALHLSHGTAEQIYLLLRLAMAEHLTKPGEVCPLMLDDVTVQSDAERTRAILSMLHTLSQERQVIIFSQKKEVVDWAIDTLQSPQDHVEQLFPVPVSS